MFTRAPLRSAAATSGGGTMTLAIDGDAAITDAAGRSQAARVYDFDATGLADLVGHQWEALDGTMRYALDPVGGNPVQMGVDAEVDWTSATTSRLHMAATVNPPPGLLDLTDTLLPLVRLVDTFGGRSYEEGQRIVGGPGRAMFATARTMEPIAPPAQPRGPARPSPRPARAHRADTPRSWRCRSTSC